MSKTHKFKRIHLEQITRPDKTSSLTFLRRYRVYLGHHVTVSFTREIDAKAFLAQTNRFLNDRVKEINMLYIEIWTEYRRMYIVFYEFMKNEQYWILQQRIDRIIDFMIRRSSWQNGSSFVYKWFMEILDLLEEFARSVHDILKEKKRNYNTFEMYILIQRIDAIRKAIDSYGRDLAEKNPPGFY